MLGVHQILELQTMCLKYKFSWFLIVEWVSDDCGDIGTFAIDYASNSHEKIRYAENLWQADSSISFKVTYVLQKTASQFCSNHQYHQFVIATLFSIFWDKIEVKKSFFSEFCGHAERCNVRSEQKFDESLPRGNERVADLLRTVYYFKGKLFWIILKFAKLSSNKWILWNQSHY